MASVAGEEEEGKKSCLLGERRRKIRILEKRKSKD
jgi:hypothetical protein